MDTIENKPSIRPTIRLLPIPFDNCSSLLYETESPASLERDAEISNGEYSLAKAVRRKFEIEAT